MRARAARGARAARRAAAALLAGWTAASSAAVVAHWQFNERTPGSSAPATPGAVLDASGNGYHLTAAGSPLPQYAAGAAHYGGTSALKFTAGNDCVQTAQTAGFDFGVDDSFTLEAVIRTAPGATFTGNIVGRDWGSNLPSWWFRLEGGSPRFLIAQQGGPEPNVTASAPVNDGLWHHVAAVRDAANRKLRVYVDHALAGEVNDTTTLPPTNAQNVVIGAYNNGARQFEGEMDFVRVSRGVLAPGEFVQPVLAITDLQPASGEAFAVAAKGLRFTVFSDFGVDASGIQLALNGSNRSSGLIITGTPNRREVRFEGLLSDRSYWATISVGDRLTNHMERALQFDTYAGHTVPVYVRGEDGYHTYRIPALLVTPQGTVLALAEARKNSASDAGDIDLVVKRSLDNGRAWSAQQVIWSDGANTIGNPCPVVDRDTGTIWLPFCRNNDRVFITQSTDDGVTWASPVEITSTTKLPSWGWYATGPGVGIQLEKGEHKGRLVIPCDYNGTAGSSTVHGSHVICSDDHGQSWRLGGVIGPNVNECQVVELADGRLLMNMRNADRAQDYRALATSTDGGDTWTPATHDPTLVEPICQASFLRYTLAGDYGRNRLLFSNPASKTSRVNLTVRLSYDEGQTWPAAKTLHAAAAAYSCLTVLADMSLGCLYEAGASSAYETITFSRFSLAWLTEGADRPVRRSADLRSSGGQMLLTWPAEYAGAEVEAAEDLAVDSPWTLVAAEQAVVQDRWQVVLSSAPSPRFFRLVWTNDGSLAVGRSSSADAGSY